MRQLSHSIFLSLALALFTITSATAGISKKIIQLRDAQLSHSVTIEYPKLHSGNAQANREFNQAVMHKVRQRLQRFRRAVKEFSQKELSSLSITYKLTRYRPKLFVSVKFTEDSYLARAAHPNRQPFTFNYDIQSQRFLTLKSIFDAKTNYLKFISEYCVTKLMLRDFADRQQVQAGAGPRLENFQSWNITPQGILITFDPYTVGPYAAGPQLVLLPKALLAKYVTKNAFALFGWAEPGS